MSTSPEGVDDADRLARVKLSRTIEPGDIRVTGLVSEVGGSNVLLARNHELISTYLRSWIRGRLGVS